MAHMILFLKENKNVLIISTNEQLLISYLVAKEGERYIIQIIIFIIILQSDLLKTKA